MGGCEKRTMDKFLVSKSKGKRLLQRQRRKLEDDIKMDIKNAGWCILLAWDREQRPVIVDKVMKLYIP
jgi:hypothetical protein